MNGEDDLVFTSGSSRKVSLRESEKELSRLWEVAGDEARAHGGESVMRLRELNLVIYATGETIADHVSGVISRLSQRHPARAIVLLELEDASTAEPAHPIPADVASGAVGAGTIPPLDAWVTAACYLTREGGRNVCWEQVTVPGRGASAGLLHAAAVSLLVPDLPTVLWWPGEPQTDGHTFQRLGEVSDLVVVDSAGFPDPIAGLGRLARVVYDGSRNYGLGDLNWSRLAQWRDMTAELFDDPAHRLWLDGISRIVVSYGSEDPYGRANCTEGPAAARALLYSGWFISRLGWAPVRDGWVRNVDGVRATLRPRAARGPSEAAAGGATIELVLNCAPDVCGPLGGLGGVVLQVGSREGGGGQPEAELSMVLSPEECVGLARVSAGGRETLVRTYDLTPAPEDRLLADELDFLIADPLYEEALLTAATLAALPGADLLRGGG